MTIRLTEVIIVALCVACSGTSDTVPGKAARSSPDLLELLGDSAKVVGGRDTSNVDGLLANVQYARLLGGSRGAIVAADFVEPLLRVFDKTGKLIATALPLGAGPQEARMVYGLAVSSMNHILVYTNVGFREYLFENDTIRFLHADARPADRPIFTIGSRCGRGWVAYTVALDPSTAPILEVGDRDRRGHLDWQRGLAWYTDARHPGWGRLYQISSGDRYVYIRHQYHPAAPILAIPCNERGDSAAVLRNTRTAPSDRQVQRVSEHKAVAVISYPDTLYTGFAVQEGMLLESETVTDRLPHEPDETVVNTILSIGNGKDRVSAIVNGGWQIMDARDGAILIYTQEPEPHLVLSSFAAFRRVLLDSERPGGI